MCCYIYKELTLYMCAALLSQKAVTAYLKSKQLMPFDFARQCDELYVFPLVVYLFAAGM